MIMMRRIRRLFSSRELLSWKYNLLIYLRFGVVLYCVHLIIKGFSWLLRLYSSSYFGFIIPLSLWLAMSYWRVSPRDVLQTDAPTGVEFFCLRMSKSPDLRLIRSFSLSQKLTRIFGTELSGLLFGTTLSHVIRRVTGSQDNGDDGKLLCSLPAVGFTCNFCTQNLGFNLILGVFLSVL